MDKPHILVITSDDVYWRIFKRLLGPEGWEIIGTVDAGEALAALDTRPVHLVVVSEPVVSGGDGLQMLDFFRLRAPDVKRVFLGNPDELDGREQRRLDKAEVHSVLVPPVKKDDVLALTRGLNDAADETPTEAPDG